MVHLLKNNYLNCRVIMEIKNIDLRYLRFLASESPNYLVVRMSNIKSDNENKKIETHRHRVYWSWSK